MTVFPLTPSERAVLDAIKCIYCNNDQIPTAMGLAKYLGIGDKVASRWLTRFRERGFIVKNDIGGYRWTRTPYVIKIIRPDEELNQTAITALEFVKEHNKEE